LLTFNHNDIFKKINNKQHIYMARYQGCTSTIILLPLPPTPKWRFATTPRVRVFFLSIPRTNLLPKQVKNARFTHNAQGDDEWTGTPLSCTWLVRVHHKSSVFHPELTPGIPLIKYNTPFDMMMVSKKLYSIVKCFIFRPSKQ